MIMRPFERAYVINLPRRADRLRAFRERLARAEWPAEWPAVEVYPAIDGDVVGTPDEFQHGSGAYGCRMSHLRLLQDCLMRGTDSVCVFEDDADLLPDVGPKLAQFCEAAPADWQGLMIGGQHHTPPQPVQGHPDAVRVQNAQRTHAYIARGEYLRGLQRRWGNSDQHIDWRMRGWQQKYRVYAPQRWLVGQCGGRSDVYKAPKPPEWWNGPAGDEPILVLESPRSVVEALRGRGFHAGFQRDAGGVDEGLNWAYSTQDPEERRAKLKSWLRVMQGECAGGWIVTVWHPRASIEDFRGITTAPLAAVSATTEAEVFAAIPQAWRNRIERSTASRQAPIMLLRAPRPAMEALLKQGFHAGYWRDDRTGIDQGLKAVYERPEAGRPAALAAWCTELLAEADREGKVLLAWHPGVTLAPAEYKRASGRLAVPVQAGTAEEALGRWEQV